MIDDQYDGGDEALSVQPMVACWRCGLEVAPASPTCPHCAARHTPSREAAYTDQAAVPRPAPPFKALIWSYVLLLTTGVVHATVLNARFEGVDVLDQADVTQMLVQILTVEGIDTLIVVFTVLACVRALSWPERREARRLAPWILAVPVLAGILAVNFAYHWMLREQLGLPLIQDALTARRDWMVLLAVGVQPAVIEELYFRSFALRTLRIAVGPHAAVWIVALMFGLSHVAVPLSIPYLILLGGCLGYLRVWSGTVWLPIGVHLVHNLAVVVVESSW